MYAYDSTYFDNCFEDYDGSSVIWAQVTQVGNVALSQIQNGTTSVGIQSADGPVLVDVGNVANVAVFEGPQAQFDNVVSSGNITAGGHFVGDGSLLTNIQVPGVFGLVIDGGNAAASSADFIIDGGGA
jgi:hypothetical protein